MLRALFSRRFARIAGGLLAAACVCLGGVRAASAEACVWKVSSGGHTLYLAGSIHVLRDSDYPLPPEYDQAFRASAGLAFETDPKATAAQWQSGMEQAAQLPKGVTLRDRVDPRTYAYILRILANVHGSTEPEKKIEHVRPWALAEMLHSPKSSGLPVGHGRGVEDYLVPKAEHAHKRMAGLVSFREHMAVFGGMSDVDNEIYLLHTFIHLDTEDAGYDRNVAAWKRGDTDTIDRMFRQEYSDAPSIRQRIIVDRNLVWLPKIEDYLRSGQTWMIVAGAAHMSGSDGLPAMLRARGYQVEQF